MGTTVFEGVGWIVAVGLAVAVGVGGLVAVGSGVDVGGSVSATEVALDSMVCLAP